MFLMGKRAEKSSIALAINMAQFPEKLEPSILESLTLKSEQGDESATMELFNGHARLAVAIASQYAKRMRSKSEEYVSVAFAALAQAAQWISEGRISSHSPRNPTGYICTTIHSFLSDFISKDAQVTVSKYLLQKLELDPDDFFALLDYSIEVDGDIGFNFQHLHECLVLSIKTPIEQLIVELRVGGHTDDEIAERLEMSKSNVRKIRMALYERFLGFYNEHTNLSSDKAGSGTEGGLIPNLSKSFRRGIRHLWELSSGKASRQ